MSDKVWPAPMLEAIAPTYHFFDGPICSAELEAHRRLDKREVRWFRVHLGPLFLSDRARNNKYHHPFFMGPLSSAGGEAPALQRKECQRFRSRPKAPPKNCSFETR
ncbi:hypothetical protein B0X16_13055 [Listeria monocytogenes]|nr:hypothetical protein B0X16_13055 [Listeria monocytogenes]